MIWATPESTHIFLRISFLVRLTHKICSGDHCQLLLLHLLERALWSLRDPQHLHCKTSLCSYVSTKWPCILLMCDADDVKALLKQGFGSAPNDHVMYLPPTRFWVGSSWWYNLQCSLGRPVTQATQMKFVPVTISTDIDVHRWSMYLELYRLIFTKMKYVPGTTSTDIYKDELCTWNYIDWFWHESSPDGVCGSRHAGDQYYCQPQCYYCQVGRKPVSHIYSHPPLILY